MSSPGQSAPARRRLKKRIWIPALLLVIVILALLGAWVRGTWADTEAINPSSSAEGIITQLYQMPDGAKQVRCAVLLDRPMRDVWTVLTDYDRFAEIFPTLTSAHGKPDAANPDQYHLTGELSSPVGTWTFSSVITHEESPEKFVAHWDSTSGPITRNRGSWTLTPAGEGKTLLVYTLEVEVRRWPTFLVRNVLLSRQRTVVESVVRQLRP
jgi:uncharacterized membrane protein